MKQYTDYKNTLVKITFPFKGGALTVEFLSKLLLGATKVYDSYEECQKAKRYRSPGDTREVHFLIDHYQTWLHKEIEFGLKKIFNPEYLSYEVVEQPKFKDNFELLDHLMGNMDWNYAYSDDHRVWAAGVAKENHIKTLINNLTKEDEKKVKAICSKYDKLAMVENV